MQGKKIKKQYKQIFFVMLAIIYVCMLFFIAFKYIGANRYWKIDGFEKNITVESGQDISVRANVKNKMYYDLDSRDNYFFSYHLYDGTGKLIQYDNPRTQIKNIKPGQTQNVEVQIKAPTEKGKYMIKIDLVKEGEYWFSDRGETPGTLFIDVK